MKLCNKVDSFWEVSKNKMQNKSHLFFSEVAL